MQYSLEYLPDKNFVRIEMHGRLNFQIAEQYSKEAVKLARQNDCSNFLIDHSETIIQSSTANIYASGDELQEFGFKNSDRLAIVLTKLSKDSSVREPVTQNSRWCATKYFKKDNIEKAYEWLSESEQ